MITTNLEQSKKLKELGVPQETFLRWEKERLSGKWYTYKTDKVEYIHPNTKWYAAYTLDELIEWLAFHYSPTLWAFRPDGWKEGDVRYRATSAYSGYGEHEGATPLEAVYNLCCAIKEAITTLKQPKP